MAFGILLQIVNEFGVEKTAQLARAAEESFKRIETDLEIELAKVNPIDPVNNLLDQSSTHLRSFYTVVPRFSALSSALKEEAKTLADRLIAENEEGWVLPPASRKKPTP